jgi:hypothetical protein
MIYTLLVYYSFNFLIIIYLVIHNSIAKKMFKVQQFQMYKKAYLKLKDHI